MTLRLYLLSFLALVAYMSVWFVVARYRKRLDTVDVAWGGAFVVMALLVAIVEPTARTLMIAVLVSIWGVRLMTHIARRARKKDEDDPRYVEIAAKWKGNYWFRAFISIFMTQAVLASLVGLPIIFAAGMVLPDNRWLFTAGYFVWVIGFFYEYYADKQLAQFLSDPDNKGKLLDSGLWRYSRHPNYFGELLQWWGIGLIALQTSWGWIGLAGPLLLSILIRYVSGVPPIERRRAKDPKYAGYTERTSAIIPWFVDEPVSASGPSAASRTSKRKASGRKASGRKGRQSA